MVLLTFVWKCFQDRNFHGAVVGLYEQSIESWVGLVLELESLNLMSSWEVLFFNYLSIILVKDFSCHRGVI